MGFVTRALDPFSSLGLQVTDALDKFLIALLENGEQDEWT